MEFQEMKERLTNKFILLDTNVIARSFEHFDNFEGFLRFFQETECALTYFPMIEFEFLRGAHLAEHRKARTEFLKTLAFEQMPFDPQVVYDALKIANAYVARNRKLTPSIVDCCIAAYLKEYADNLYLATLNHSDFPTYLFDRIYVWPVDTEKDVFPIGIYQFNTQKAKDIGVL